MHQHCVGFGGSLDRQGRYERRAEAIYPRTHDAMACPRNTSAARHAVYSSKKVLR